MSTTCWLCTTDTWICLLVVHGEYQHTSLVERTGDCESFGASSSSKLKIRVLGSAIFICSTEMNIIIGCFVCAGNESQACMANNYHLGPHHVHHIFGQVNLWMEEDCFARQLYICDCME